MREREREHGSKSACPSRTPVNGRETQRENGGARGHDEGLDRGRSPQSDRRRRGGRRSQRRARRVCYLSAEPCWPESPRTLGETVPRASLGGGKRWWPRGRHLAGRLVASGESVVDVPSKLSARVRVLSTGNARKNDGVDALATALAAWRHERLAAVDPEAASEV